jgi:uncharacterized protein (DUF736 family)
MSEKQYDDTNRGALFPAEKKSDKHPDLKGKLNVGGKDYYLSAWSQVSKAGKKYLSVAVDEPRAAEATPEVATADESLPF